jgi:hypothetical protein
LQTRLRCHCQTISNEEAKGTVLSEGRTKVRLIKTVASRQDLRRGIFSIEEVDNVNEAINTVLVVLSNGNEDCWNICGDADSVLDVKVLEDHQQLDKRSIMKGRRSRLQYRLRLLPEGFGRHQASAGQMWCLHPCRAEDCAGTSSDLLPKVNNQLMHSTNSVPTSLTLANCSMKPETPRTLELWVAGVVGMPYRA